MSVTTIAQNPWMYKNFVESFFKIEQRWKKKQCEVMLYVVKLQKREGKIFCFRMIGKGEAKRAANKIGDGKTDERRRIHPYLKLGI